MPAAQQRTEDRRVQILRATVEVVAESGYQSATFARIVEHAKLSSPRLISYHFQSREILMREALAHVVDQAREFIQPRIARAGDARGRLAAYIRGNLEFLAAERAYAVAAVQIVANLPAVEGTAEQADVSVALLEQHFVAAQAAGEMRRFDPTVMAASLRAAIDAAVLRSVAGEIDLQRYAEELVQIFDRATAPEAGS